MNWALVKIELSFFANKFKDARPNNPKPISIFRIINNELFPVTLILSWYKKLNTKSKNSVPISPNNVRNKRGKSTAILPRDFENRYVKDKQIHVVKSTPYVAWLLRVSKKP